MRARVDFEPCRSECPNCGRVFSSTFGLTTHFGQAVRNGKASTCIGVVRPDFRFELTTFGVWRPVERLRGKRWVRV